MRNALENSGTRLIDYCRDAEMTANARFRRAAISKEFVRQSQHRDRTNSFDIDVSLETVCYVVLALSGKDSGFCKILSDKSTSRSGQ